MVPVVVCWVAYKLNIGLKNCSGLDLFLLTYYFDLVRVMECGRQDSVSCKSVFSFWCHCGVKYVCHINFLWWLIRVELSVVTNKRWWHTQGGEISDFSPSLPVLSFSSSVGLHTKMWAGSLSVCIFISRWLMIWCPARREHEEPFPPPSPVPSRNTAVMPIHRDC